ncbi:LysR family transcriptional regulator [Xanthobacter sp. V0B-10]|uniref:LysR family transcriptional regulator n=1 Tax=Xanthobacter albus TaxID=3119929 RepID=UPI003729CBA3
MVTLKQIEAVHWVEKLGSFHAAAERLNTTQSTISKRVQELEGSLGIPLFDRTSNGTQLTLRGRELLGDFSAMLRLRQNILQKAGIDTSYSGHFRLGVTEMVALTWLPQLIRSIRALYPDIVLSTSVDLTQNLLKKLGAYKLDLALCPAVHVEEAAAFPSLRLSALESAWMCAPDLAHGRRGLLTASDIAAMPLLTFAEGSLLHQTIAKALNERGFSPKHTITCSSMIALAELARAGLGVSFLPRDYFHGFGAGSLSVLQTNLVIPPLEYAAVYREDFIALQIADLAREHCNFAYPRP